MNLIKRFGLLILTNIAVIFLFSIIVYLIQIVFGIDLRQAAGSGYSGLLIYAALFGFLGSFFSLFISRWSAKKAYSIVPINAQELFKLTTKERLVYDTVTDLAQRNGINTPEVGIYHAEEPNAFATGATKNSSLVAVSTGLLNHMSEREIEAVVAHEMAHILNGDMVTMTLLQGVMNTFVIFFARIAAEALDNFTDGKLGSIGFIVVNLVLQVLLGFVAGIVVNAFSRHREFRADEGSANMVGTEKMISALIALQKLQDITKSDSSKLATMKISTKSSGSFSQLFMSHPPLEKRILSLQGMKI